jgi:hypothetical protein
MDFREVVWGVETGSIWLRIGTGGGLLWIRWWTFGLDVLASQDGLCATELVSQFQLTWYYALKCLGIGWQWVSYGSVSYSDTTTIQSTVQRHSLGQLLHRSSLQEVKKLQTVNPSRLWRRVRTVQSRHSNWARGLKDERTQFDQTAAAKGSLLQNFHTNYGEPHSLL